MNTKSYNYQKLGSSSKILSPKLLLAFTFFFVGSVMFSQIQQKSSSVVITTEPAVLANEDEEVTLNGSITSGEITEKGFIYSSTISSDEGLILDATGVTSIVADSTQTGAYSKEITDLEAGEYSYRAYARSGGDKTYGIVQNFRIKGAIDHFVIKIRTDRDNDQFTFYGAGSADYDIDWNGDGDFTDDEDVTQVSGNQTHTFEFEGEYIIRLRNLTKINLLLANSKSDIDKYISIEQWGTSQWNTNMDGAFAEATNLTIADGAGTPDFSQVTRMSQMFLKATSLNSDISGWNVSNVTTMSSMFGGATSFNQNIGGWNVSNVIDMQNMFKDATSFNQNIGGWNVSNVIIMQNMFNGATSFDQNLGNWNVSKLAHISNMFAGITLSTENYDALLIGWGGQTLVGAAPAGTSNIRFHAGNSRYCSDEAETARQSITSSGVWVITDGGKCSAPDVDTPPATTVSLVSATLNGNISSDGGFPITERGFVYSTSVSSDEGLNLDSLDVTKLSVEGIEIGDFTKDFTAITADSTYHYRAYGINGVGTTYGNIQSLKISTASDHFVLKIRTTQANENFTFYTLDINYDIDWENDQTFEEENVSENKVHQFETAGDHIIRFRNLESVFVNYSQDREKYISIEQWGTVQWGGGETVTTNSLPMSFAFYGTSNLTIAANAGTPDFSEVTFMAYAFSGSSFNGENAGNWNISRVTNMQDLFTGASLPTENYEAILIGWAAQETQQNVSFNAGNSRYCSQDAIDAKAVLISRGWTIVDLGECRAPILTEPTITELAYMSAIINFQITSDGGFPITGLGYIHSFTDIDQNDFVIGHTSSGLTTISFVGVGSPHSKNIVFAEGQTSYYRIYATNSRGTTYSDKQEFTAPTRAAPVITTTAATMITYNSAVMGGNITSNGGEAIRQKGFVYSKTISTDDDLIIGTNNNDIINEVIYNSEIGDFSKNINLEPGIYYFRAYATNGAYTGYGDVETFTIYSTDDYFVLKVRTTTANETFTFQTEDTDYDIDWNDDGYFTDTNDVMNASGNQTINFPNAGNHTIRFRNLTDIFINNQGDKDKYISIEQWGTAVWDADMYDAFSGASNLTVADDAGTPDMSEVTNMRTMFWSATSFNGNIGDWNISSVTNMNQMFENVALSPENYDALLIGWNALATPQNEVNFHAGNSRYTSAGEAARANLVDSTSSGGRGWTITDGGMSSSNTVPTGIFLSSTEIEETSGDSAIVGTLSNTNTTGSFTYTLLSEDNVNDDNDSLLISGTELKLKASANYDTKSSYSIRINVNNGTGNFAKKFIISVINRELTDDFILKITTTTNGEEFTFATRDTNYSFDFNNNGSFSDNVDGKGIGRNRTHHLDAAGEHIIRFRNLTNFSISPGDRNKHISVEQWGTAVWDANMSRAFLRATNLTFAADAGTPDMSQVTDMSDMFNEATSFNTDISDWDVSNVTNFTDAFDDSGLSVENYEALLIGWNNLDFVQVSTRNFGASGLIYCSEAAIAARTSLRDSYSWEISGDAKCAEPIINNTPTVTSKNNNSARLNGNITSNGGSPITMRGFVYIPSSNLDSLESLEINPGHSLITNVIVEGTGIGDFSKNITGLLADTQYTYKAYATNSVGIVYSSGINFTTLLAAIAPEVTTAQETEISNTSKTLNGDITSNGGSLITERGFVYSKIVSTDDGLMAGTNNSDITTTIVVSTEQEGTFSKTLTNLSGGEYYFRAYAINEVNTVHGEIQNFRVIGALDYFVIKVETTTADEEFTFYTEDTDYDIDWNNNGSFTDDVDMTNVSSNQIYSFPTLGEHTIRLRNLTDIYINDQADKDKYLSVEQWGTAVWNENMSAAFKGATNLTFADNAGTPDMSEVTNMSEMFREATAFNSNIGTWNVSSVININQMFYEATSFNQNIGTWDVSSLKFAAAMFFRATSFDQNLGTWNVSNVTNVLNMFQNATLSTTNYEALLIAWSGLTLQQNVSFHAGNSKYCSEAAKTAKGNIENMYNWTISDGGECVAPTVETTSATMFGYTSATLNGDITDDGGDAIIGRGFVYSSTASSQVSLKIDSTSVTHLPVVVSDTDTSTFSINTGDNLSEGEYYFRAYARNNKGTSYGAIDTLTVSVATDHFVLKIKTTQANENFVFYTEDTNYNIDWDNNGIFEENSVSGNKNHTFDIAGEHTIRFINLNDISINDGDDKDKYLSVEQWGTAVWNADMNRAFKGASNINFADGAGNPDFSEVEYINGMFTNATSFNSDISGWNVSNVTNMAEMFSQATSFNQNLGSWNVSNVSNFSSFLLNNNLSIENYEALLIGWNNLPSFSITTATAFHAGNSIYCSDAAETARGNLINSHSFTFHNDAKCSAPVINSPGSSAVTNISATIEATIGSNGGKAVTEKGFLYSQTSITADSLDIDNVSAGITKIVVMTEEEIGIFSKEITPLEGDTTYYFIGYAKNSEGTEYSDVANFTTLDAEEEPTVNTSEATLVTDTSATLNGGISSNGGGAITERGFIYSSTISAEDIEDNLQFNTDNLANGVTVLMENSTGTGNFSKNINLVLGKYYYRTYAKNSTGTGYGDVKRFQVFDAAGYFILEVETSSADENFVFYTQDTDYDIDWNDDGDFTDTNDKMNVSGNQTINFPNAGNHTIRFRNLTDIFINNQGDKDKYISIEQWGTAVWDANMFDAFSGASNLTVADEPGTPDMSEVTNMRTMFWSATSFNGNIGDWDISSVTDMTQMFENVALSVSNYEALLIGWSKLILSQGNSFNAGNSSYCSQAAKDAIEIITGTYTWGISYSSDDSGECTKPIVSTLAGDNISTTSAELKGDIISKGRGIITEKGFVYSLSRSNLLKGRANVMEEIVSDDTETSTTFSKNITGITSGVEYHYRAYAINGAGTTYGIISSFTTLEMAIAPSVSTEDISDVTSSSATLNGNVTSNGGEAIIERGFVYSATVSDTDDLIINTTDVEKLISSSTDNIFDVNIIDLDSKTIYNFRAYATNNVGTTYGDVQSFITAIMIVDTNLKQQLVSVPGLDMDGDGEISLAEAQGFTGALNLSNMGISDIRGLEAFINVTSIDLSDNGIANIDVLLNLSTTSTGAKTNNNNQAIAQGSSADLVSLNVSENRITSIDISRLPSLRMLDVSNNSLTYLNISNGIGSGNNSNVLTFFDSRGNENLSCIQVNNIFYIPGSSEANPGDWSIDYETANYSTYCSTAGNDEFNLTEVSISPNPTSSTLNIIVKEKMDYRLLNIRGQVLKIGVLFTGEENKLDISSLSKGVYLLNLITDRGNSTRKVVRN